VLTSTLHNIASVCSMNVTKYYNLLTNKQIMSK